jgi:uncharacterized protein YjbI with pentapeptide repeats
VKGANQGNGAATGHGSGPRTSSKRPLKDILQRVYQRESLAGVDLRNLYFSGMDFSGLDLRAANLKGCHLNNATMVGSDLTDTDLTDASLVHACFRGANLIGAKFVGAVVAGADFARAKGLSLETKAYLKLKGAKGL